MTVPHINANKLVLARLTVGRFVGEPIPSSGLSLGPWLWAWGRWLARLLLLHVPSRLCVLMGDLCQHDWHHRHPRGDWSNAGYARQRDRAAGCPGWPEAYREVWGLGNAIDAVFEGLASLPPLPESTLSPSAVADVALGM
jgi:hypothetical protein